MASEGLGLITYFEQMNLSEPYTQNWYYQPEIGWLWTNENTFPFIYQAGEGNSTGNWFYFSQLEEQGGPALYDYQTESWIYPTDTD